MTWSCLRGVVWRSGSVSPMLVVFFLRVWICSVHFHGVSLTAKVSSPLRFLVGVSSWAPRFCVCERDLYQGFRSTERWESSLPSGCCTPNPCGWGGDTYSGQTRTQDLRLTSLQGAPSRITSSPALAASVSLNSGRILPITRSVQC